MSRHSPFLVLCCTASWVLWSQAPAVHVIQDLHFGDLVVDLPGGAVALTSEGILVSYGAGVQTTGRSLVQEARFALAGPPNTRFRVSMIPPTPMLSDSSGSQVRIESFVWPTAGEEGVFDAQGQALLRVGARLNIPAGIPAGSYVTRQVSLQLALLNGKSGQPATQEFSITARVRPILRLVNLAGLEFGELIPGPVDGRYVVLAEGGGRREGTGGPTQFKGNPHPAVFQLSGATGTWYSLELPGRVWLQGPGAPVELQGFQCNVPLQSSVPVGGLRFQVGAGLVVPAHQAPGVYRGIFTVSVNYQ